MSRTTRKHSIWACFVLVLGLCVSGGPAVADSLRCGGALIQTGDPAAVVRNKCGAPDFVDPWIGGSGLAYGQTLSMEEWTYNRGPSRLLQILVFRDGKLQRIRDDGYGFTVRRGANECRPTDIARGMSKYRLLQACGEPIQKSGGFVFSRRNDVGTYDYRLRRGVNPVYREKWVFNFGGNRLLREVTLENAIVVDSDTLERGFDR
ncbi:DUF2845 domain-containing protein [Endozoicomonas sp. G2_2]|uniref:DUF2845 domain-containing protein n=1 Tax=Endozoicomonas sp. G2_2 TaxID=2821092 RepID=UPI001ADB4326|nr:DUF2845 domain-containing protein [Endozoicomonas sp. G2_2]MBO9471236.1 DUF2845 domain-containing protein [Endozoicomonas sp. G2_2]